MCAVFFLLGGERNTVVPARYVNLSRMLRGFGLSRAAFAPLRRKHPLFRPAFQGLPGDGAPHGVKTLRYHVEQVRLIEGVLIGNVSMEDAWIEWQAIRGQIGRQPLSLPGRKRR